MNLTDDEIIEHIRRGDARKFALLVDRHKDKAFTLAVRVIGDRHEAEESVQDGFMRAYRNLGQFRGDARFSTWLYRIVYNVCMTKVTRKRQRPESMDVQSSLVANTFVDDEDVASDIRLENEEYRAILRDEVEMLPEKFRTAITLFYLEEMSYEEMTTVLNLPLGTIKTNLFRGRALLRERVQARLRGELV
ncbi:MAG: sigma-70 family RNA polymerase sigma factor [Ignavibacteriae bacterium]|nr:sigma-70 family RNA polymerase sigma factor [Ignavibacteriota bacterium]